MTGVQTCALPIFCLFLVGVVFFVCFSWACLCLVWLFSGFGCVWFGCLVGLACGFGLWVVLTGLLFYWLTGLLVDRFTG